MPEKDACGTMYFEGKERYADLLNVSLFDGEPVILPEHIHERNRSKVLNYTKDEKKKSTVIYRDVVREVDIQMKTAIITLEHQTDIHYAMPVRVMCGDSAMYQEQWREIVKKHAENKDLKGAEYVSGFSKEDKLKPVSTIVVYFGRESWDGPRCLKDMLDLDGFPERLKEGIADYPLHIIEVRSFADYEKFQTDLKLVFGFLQRDADQNALCTYIADHAQEFENLAEDTYEMISQYSSSKKLLKVIEGNKTETGGIDMCKAIDDMVADGEKRGEERGIERGIQNFIDVCQEFHISVESTLERIITKFSLSEDVAKEYIAKYWI